MDYDSSLPDENASLFPCPQEWCMPRKVEFLTHDHHETLDAARVALKHRNVTWDQEGWDARGIGRPWLTM